MVGTNANLGSRWRPPTDTSFNRQLNRQPTYGSGLGPIYQFGHQNPLGPYAFAAQRPGQRPGQQGGTQGGTQGGASTAANSVARDYLTGVVRGQNTPYNEATRASMYSQASGQNAAAEAAQNRRLAEQAAMGGASPTDPSYANLMRQTMAQRQGANQQAMGDIEREANVANQRTQQSAAMGLMGSEDERFALQQGYNQRAAQTALGFLYGGGGGQSSGPNNFGGSLRQGIQQENNREWAQNQVNREQELQWAREDAEWNNRNRNPMNRNPMGATQSGGRVPGHDPSDYSIFR